MNMPLKNNMTPLRVPPVAENVWKLLLDSILQSLSFFLGREGSRRVPQDLIFVHEFAYEM